MTASLHLARHSLRHTPRMLGRMRRGWDDLTTVPGLAAVRLFDLAGFDPVLGGTPNPAKWGLLCAWRDGASRDAFLADGKRLRPLLLGAEESWNVSLETVRTKDSWHGWSLPGGGPRRFDADEPALVMTYGTVRPRHLAEFTWQNRRIARSQVGAPGLVMRFGMTDHLYNRSTFSLWRTERNAIDFAYGSTPHSEVQKVARRTPWADDFFFARFRPLASSGTWEGRDLLAELR
jgi:hypothetical protein